MDIDEGLINFLNSNSFICYSIKSTLIPIYRVIISMVGARTNDQQDQSVTLNFIELLKCQNKDEQGTIIIQSLNIKQELALSNQIHVNQVCLYSSQSMVLKLDLIVKDIHLN